MMLKNKLILITKGKLDSNDALSCLESEGATVIYFATIEIESKNDSAEVETMISNFNEFDFLIFTSKNAVRVFKNLIDKNKLNLSNHKVAAVGDATAQLCIQYGIKVEIIPDRFNSKGLIEAFSQIDLEAKKVLIPCSSLSRKELEIGLTELGAIVTSIPIYDVYQTNIDDLKEELDFINLNKPDVFIFTSPSSFDNYLKILKVSDHNTYFENKIICSVGPTTEAHIRNFSLSVHVVPDNSTIENVAKAIIKYFLVSANHV